MWTICAKPVGNGGKSLWIDCRKPAAAAVEIAGISADKALDNAPDGLWIAGGNCIRTGRAQEERETCSHFNETSLPRSALPCHSSGLSMTSTPSTHRASFAIGDEQTAKRVVDILTEIFFEGQAAIAAFERPGGRWDVTVHFADAPDQALVRELVDQRRRRGHRENHRLRHGRSQGLGQGHPRRSRPRPGRAFRRAWPP